jgi:hypothetical protein
MLLTPTDLPDPVAPAIKRCGIFAKSSTTTSPVVFFPNAKGSCISIDLNLSVLITDLILTVSLT